MGFLYEIWHCPPANPQGGMVSCVTQEEAQWALESGTLPPRLAGRKFSKVQVGLRGQHGRVYLAPGSAYLGTAGLWEVEALLRPEGWTRPRGWHAAAAAVNAAENSIAQYVSALREEPGACAFAPGV